jgi:hypothetical protein
MSLEYVRRLAEELPAPLRDQVVGYARSVEEAAPEIFRDANIDFDPQLASISTVLW